VLACAGRLLSIQSSARPATHSLQLRQGEKEIRQMVRKAIFVPYTFVLMNWAVVAGLYCFMRGHRDFWNATGTRRT
jgi:hypothetical protein